MVQIDISGISPILRLLPLESVLPNINVSVNPRHPINTFSDADLSINIPQSEVFKLETMLFKLIILSSISKLGKPIYVISSLK